MFDSSRTRTDTTVLVDPKTVLRRRQWVYNKEVIRVFVITVQPPVIGELGEHWTQRRRVTYEIPER